MFIGIAIVVSFAGSVVIGYFGLPMWVLTVWIAVVAAAAGGLQAHHDERGNRQALAQLRELFTGGNRKVNYQRPEGGLAYFEIRQVEKHSE